MRAKIPLFYCILYFLYQKIFNIFNTYITYHNLIQLCYGIDWALYIPLLGIELPLLQFMYLSIHIKRQVCKVKKLLNLKVGRVLLLNNLSFAWRHQVDHYKNLSTISFSTSITMLSLRTFYCFTVCLPFA